MSTEEESEMSFLQHLEELRWRVVKSVIAILIFAVAMWFIKEWLIEHLFIAMTKPDFISFRIMCEYFNICIDQISIKFQSTQVAAQFSYALMISFVGGFILAFPYVFYQIWKFVEPGLRTNEKSASKGIIFFVTILFFLGVLFGYLVVAPMTIQFFGGFKLADDFENIWKIDSFMSLIISSVIYTGLLFLMPVVIYIFSKIGIITPEFLRKYRRHSFVGVLILAAVITPPDFISQIIVAVPIVILYEISILISANIEKKRQQEI
ncbi:MAG TPA: twin-arginine translocase subunit TatC [Brumimicrobium sp.]|nr:twin-arginine translocase subunit TatC [Brumimicrobium sp.]